MPISDARESVALGFGHAGPVVKFLVVRHRQRRRQEDLVGRLDCGADFLGCELQLPECHALVDRLSRRRHELDAIDALFQLPRDHLAYRLHATNSDVAPHEMCISAGNNQWITRSPNRRTGMNPLLQCVAPSHVHERVFTKRSHRRNTAT